MARTKMTANRAQFNPLALEARQAPSSAAASAPEAASSPPASRAADTSVQHTDVYVLDTPPVKLSITSGGDFAVSCAGEAPQSLSSLDATRARLIYRDLDLVANSCVDADQVRAAGRMEDLLDQLRSHIRADAGRAQKRARLAAEQAGASSDAFAASSEQSNAVLRLAASYVELLDKYEKERRGGALSSSEREALLLPKEDAERAMGWLK